MEFSHKPVLLDEVINGLNINPSGTYIDGTCGGAGHSIAIASRLDGLGGGFLIGIDRDPDAVKIAEKRLEPYEAVVSQGNFDEMAEIAAKYEVSSADGILLDLGVSSHQLDTPERGFSYHDDAPLDMRMSKSGLSAADVVNDYSRDELVKILFEYGEERFAYRIADRIIAEREDKPIRTTSELAKIVSDAYPGRFKRDKNPCRKTFQAIRMEVNDELEHVSVGIGVAFDLLKTGGRLAIITFHSLEDRLVKRRFLSFTKGCTCPPDFPKCVCGKTSSGILITKKPITAAEAEISENNRSRSAKLRIIEKTA
ncbi:MAG: 16S rRNA (cytosine(1402)-N(4))-methyltransferase RsmH [Ruminococcus sp.]|jgi:16S rRNA (cytosine1402-N4)-methyltransferase|nr:16S rRNA (cytosine(1402)-N(4))-methyltransferase RsmH [Ruminococcus sp.]